MSGRKTLLTALLAFADLTSAQSAASITGTWDAVDEKTGQSRGLVRIYEDHGLYFGKIETSVRPGDSQKTCTKCKDDRQGKPILGLVILRNLRHQRDGYTGGELLDADTGSVYHCKLALSGDGKTLMLRGYVGIPLLGRSQKWNRADR